MVVKMVEEVLAQVPSDDFQTLEQKVYRTIELYKAAREARSASERDAQRLREQRVKDGEDAVANEKGHVKEELAKVFETASYQSGLASHLHNLLTAYPELLEKKDLKDWEAYAPPDSLAMARITQIQIRIPAA